ncbi:MAG: hypothetical protein II951_07865 [Bacteroidales bacterium]|nr:hypothetical protein [Bacteroidales bacterium]
METSSLDITPYTHLETLVASRLFTPSADDFFRSHSLSDVGSLLRAFLSSEWQAMIADAPTRVINQVLKFFYCIDSHVDDSLADFYISSSPSPSSPSDPSPSPWLSPLSETKMRLFASIYLSVCSSLVPPDHKVAFLSFAPDFASCLSLASSSVVSRPPTHGFSRIVFLQVAEEFKRQTADLLPLSDCDSTRHFASFLFPFLSGPDVDSVSAFMETNGHWPMFRVVDSYLRRPSLERKELILAKITGLAGYERAPFESIAEEMGMSLERIRQMSKATDLLPPSLSNPELWSAYSVFTALTDGDPALASISSSEAVDVSLQAFYTVCGHAFPLSLNKLPGKHRYVLHASDDALTSWSTLLGGIIAMDSEIRREDRVVETASFLPPDTPSRDRILSIALYILRSCFDIVSTDDGRSITLRRNRARDIDWRLVFNSIGEPANAQVVAAKIEELYPERAPVRVGYVKPLLVRSDLIRAIGKSGLYALAEWDVDTRCLTQVIYDMLSESPTPLSVYQIFDSLSQSHPDSNLSVGGLTATLSQLIKTRNVIRIETGDYTLAVGEFTDRESVAGIIRQAPEARLQQLKDFIAANNRPPFVDDEQEATLYRWQRSVISGRIPVSPELMAELKELIEKTNSLPQNQREFSFYTNCRLYSAAYDKGLQSSDPALREWFLKNYKRKLSLPVKQRLWFDELLEHVEGKTLF